MTVNRLSQIDFVIKYINSPANIHLLLSKNLWYDSDMNISIKMELLDQIFMLTKLYTWKRKGEKCEQKGKWVFCPTVYVHLVNKYGQVGYIICFPEGSHNGKIQLFLKTSYESRFSTFNVIVFVWRSSEWCILNMCLLQHFVQFGTPKMWCVIFL